MCVVTLAIKTFFHLCVYLVYLCPRLHPYDGCTYNVNQYYYTISANFRVVKSGEHVVVVESNHQLKHLVVENPVEIQAPQQCITDLESTESTELTE